MACYNNNYIIYNLDKRVIGYYPRKKKLIREVVVTNSKDREFLLDRYNAEVYYNTLLGNKESNPNK